MSRIKFHSAWLSAMMVALSLTVALPASLAYCQETEEAEQTEEKSEEQTEETEDSDDQENEGQDDLDAAFDLKISASSTRDLDKVCDLCESAIKKGLDESGLSQAEELWTATLIEHADQLSKRILPPNTDKRWKIFRREALTRLEKATEISPKSYEAYILIGRLSILPGADKEAARSAIMKAVELAGDESEKLSQALVIRGNLVDDDQGKLADFNQAAKIDPTNLEAIRSRGAQYLRMGQIDKAISDFENWIELEPENVAAYYVIIQSLMSEERDEEALEWLDQLIEVKEDEARAYSVRAQLHLKLDNGDKAFNDSEQAIKLNPDDFESLMVRASVHTDRGDFQDAYDDVDRVLRLRPGLVRGHWMRSILAGQLENWDQAIDDIQLLVDDDPLNPQFKTQLAMLYNAADRPEDAVELYNKMIEADPEDADVLRGRGDAFLSLSRHEEAVEDYNEALDINPDDDGVLNNLAWVLATSPFEDVRDGERSVELATKAAELTEYKEAHILSTLASGYAETGDFEKAREWAQKAVDTSDNEDQIEGLKKELASYEQDKPWREDQFKELEEKRNSKSESEGEEKAEDEDKDEDKKDAEEDKEEDGDDDALIFSLLTVSP